MRVYLIILVALVFIIVGCQKEQEMLAPVLSSNHPISLKLNFNQTSHQVLGGQSSAKNINKLTVRVTGEGLDQPIVKDLTISTNEARGTVNVPLGQKTFDITGSVVSGSKKIDLFRGSKSINVTENTKQVEITLNEITANEIDLKWDDGTKETTAYAWSVGDILAVGFDVSDISGGVFVEEVSMNLFWEGNAGDFRIIIEDENNIRFRSGIIGTQSDGWNTWNIIYNNPVDGLFTSLIIVGLEYANANAWPEVGYDLSSPVESSLFFSVDSSAWFILTDGNLMIRAKAQTSAGKTVELKPVRSFRNRAELKAWLENRKKQ